MFIELIHEWMKFFYLVRQWFLLESIHSSERKTWGRTLRENLFPSFRIGRACPSWWKCDGRFHTVYPFSPSNIHSSSHALHSASSLKSHILGKWLRAWTNSESLAGGAGEMPRGPGSFLFILLCSLSWWTRALSSLPGRVGMSALPPTSYCCS